LYYYKGYAFTSVYYIILLAMAISGLMEWQKKARSYQHLRKDETA